MESNVESLGETLAQVVKGDIPLSQLAGLKPNELAHIMQQAIAQMQIGKHDQAVKIMQVLVTLDEQNPLFREYLGLAYEGVNDNDKALAEYTANIDGLQQQQKTGERLCEGFLLRARLHAVTGTKDEAKSDLDQAKLHHGNDPELVQEIKVLERAVAEGAS